MDDPSQLVIGLALLASLALSAVCSLMEVAFISLSPGKLRMLAATHKKTVRLLEQLKSRKQRVLSSILITSNVINTFAAGLATYAAVAFFGDAGLAIATAVMSVLILAFTDIFPKSFAQSHAGAVMRFLALPLFVLDKVLIPATWIFEKILIFFGISGKDSAVTEAELLAMVHIGTEEGELQRHEKELIENVLSFTDTRAEEIMQPRVDIVALDKSKTVAEARAVFVQNRFSRIPVYDGSIDRVLGVITLRMVMEYAETSKLSEIELLTPVFAPESRMLRPLLNEMMSRRMHMAIVLDEHGGTAGLLTLEDILEELVGEIEDERDLLEDRLRRLNSHTVLAPGDTPLWDVDKALETSLDGLYPNKNIAYLVLEKLSRLPRKHDRVRAGEVEVTVEEMEGNRIEKVKIERL